MSAVARHGPLVAVLGPRPRPLLPPDNHALHCMYEEDLRVKVRNGSSRPAPSFRSRDFYRIIVHVLAKETLAHRT